MLVAEKKIFSRWQVLSACTFVAGIAGLTTAFGLISYSLENRLNFSPTEIALIGAFGNVGSFSGYLSGVLIDFAGVRNAMYVASSMVFFGLFLIWLSIEKYLPASVGSLCLLIYICQFGAATVSQGSSSTAILIFPVESVAQIAGLSKAYYGIAGAILSSIAGSYFLNADNAFILFATLFMSIGIACGGFFFNLLPANLIDFSYEFEHQIRTDLSPYLRHLLGLVSLIVIFAALDVSNLPSSWPSLAVATVIILWQMSLLLLPLISYNGFVTQSVPLLSPSPSLSHRSTITPTPHAPQARLSILETALFPHSQIADAAALTELLRSSRHRASNMSLKDGSMIHMSNRISLLDSNLGSPLHDGYPSISRSSHSLQGDRSCSRISSFLDPLEFS
jgi:MFS family permease